MDYETLFVTAIPSNRVADQVVAFLGKQRVLFEDESRQPAPGETIPVMLTRPLYRKTEDGGYNFNALTAVLVQEVNDDYVLVHHDGFVLDPATGQTYANVTEFDYPMKMSPGRTAVYVADQSKDPLAEKRPGLAYVLRSECFDGNVARCEGLASWQDAAYASAFKVD